VIAVSPTGWVGQYRQILVFMPMAISFVGASVIWKFVYDYRGEAETRSVSSTPSSRDGPAAAGLDHAPFWNSIFLMVILIWIQTGFAMVILSAALRGIPRRLEPPHRRRQ
jgi:alpha-glucoside transport system permease protein